MPPTEPAILVIGAGGLLGSAIMRASGGGVAVRDVAWEKASAADTVADQVRGFVGRGDAAAVVWAAGAGVIGSGQADLDSETAIFSRVLETLDGFADVPVVIASSAGGVHGGATDTPICESDDPHPISAYGDNKVRQESILRDWCAATGGRGVIGRLATVYGPGQSLEKAQGLISTLCHSAVTRRPVSIYVPLDTLRDFVYVDDAAAVLVACARRAAEVEAGSVVTKIIGSARSCSLGAVIGETRRVCPRPPLVVLGSSPHGASHGTALVFRSRVWNDLDRLCRTPMASGIAATYRSIAGQVARAEA